MRGFGFNRLRRYATWGVSNVSARLEEILRRFRQLANVQDEAERTAATRRLASSLDKLCTSLTVALRESEAGPLAAARQLTIPTQACYAALEAQRQRLVKEFHENEQEGAARLIRFLKRKVAQVAQGVSTNEET